MKNKTFFRYQSVTVAAGVPSQPNFEGEFLLVYAVVGIVEMSLTGDGDWFPLQNRLKLRFKAHDRFKKVFLRSTLGGSVTFYYGCGDITIGNEDSDLSPQVLIGASDDPNDAPEAYTPADPSIGAVYYRTKDDGLIQLWLWSVAEATWKPAIT